MEGNSKKEYLDVIENRCFSEWKVVYIRAERLINEVEHCCCGNVALRVPDGVVIFQRLQDIKKLIKNKFHEFSLYSGILHRIDDAVYELCVASVFDSWAQEYIFGRMNTMESKSV